MLDGIIRFALRRRLLVLSLAAFLLVYGTIITRQLPMDVFPDLAKPTVTILTDAHGMAPEEVEALVTFPIENALGGIAGVDRIRSSSGIGLSVIYVEFGWGHDIYRSRQLVAERLQIARNNLPLNIQPVLGPIASLMGQVQQIAIGSPDLSPVELRSLAEWVIKPQLMAIPGIAQTIVMGGGLRQYQVLISAEKMNRYQISLEQLDAELRQISQNSPGGLIEEDDREVLVRNIGTISSVDDIENTAIGMQYGRPVLLKDISQVQEGIRFKRGEASYMGQPAVILVIQKQPGSDTLGLTKKVESVLESLKPSLPESVIINPNIFRQADFIEASIDGIVSKLQMGSILVFLVLLLFLAKIRMSLITLTAIPLSFISSFIVFKLFGLSINTMTLGGLAIAIGELVDDSIVDMENIHRRLRENKKSQTPKPSLRVVFEASSEVRNSIVMSTIIIALVFFPLLMLTGLEGRLYSPLAISYLTALFTSLLVSLTVTPALCFYLLKDLSVKKAEDTWFVKQIKKIDRQVLHAILDKPWISIPPAILALIAALLLIPLMGRDFLPKFNEPTAMITVFAPIGTSLAASDEIGRQVDQMILATPGVVSVSRRTGRADQDEHAMGVHISEIDLSFDENLTKDRSSILNHLRNELNEVPGLAAVSVDQPLAHLIDHLLSGVNAQLAIKIFGPELGVLRAKAAEIRRLITPISGLVDTRVEAVGFIPEIKIYVMRDEAAAYGLSPGQVTKLLETALNGQVVGQVIEGQRLVDLFAQFDSDSRGSQDRIEDTIIQTLPDGRKLRVRDIADVYRTEGPNEINRENFMRRIVVSANISGRDSESVVSELQSKINSEVAFPEGYFYRLEGQFEAQRQASKDILIFSLMSLMAISVVLYSHFRSWILVGQVLFTIPLAFIGGITALYLSNGVISIASLIGFVTLCGIASRNSILMLSHYLHLQTVEGEVFSKEMVIRGSLERLVPVLMTASIAILALLPLVLARGEIGSEILQPMATVVVGGLITSTMLDIIVTPTLYYWFGQRSSKLVLAFAQNQEEL